MLCNSCGKEIPDDSVYCPECSAPVDEPVVIKLSKEDIINKEKENKIAKKVEKYNMASEMPAFSFSEYLKTLKNDASCFLALLGGLILFYSTFFTWIWERTVDDKIKLNLFDLSSKNADKGVGSNTLLIAGVLVLITAVIMIILSAAKNIRALVVVSDNMIIKFLPVVMAVIIFIVIIANKEYNNALNAVENTIRAITEAGAPNNYDGGRGEGIIIYCVGTLIYTASVILKKEEDN